jgi:hypothetical protein
MSVADVRMTTAPAGPAHRVWGHGWPSVLPVFVVGLEDALGVGFEQRLAGPQPRLRLSDQCRAVKVKLADLLQPALKLLQVDIVLL